MGGSINQFIQRVTTKKKKLATLTVNLNFYVGVRGVAEFIIGQTTIGAGVFGFCVRNRQTFPVRAQNLVVFVPADYWFRVAGCLTR